MPCDNKPIACVVSLAAADGDQTTDAETLQQSSGIATGILHEDQSGDAELFDGSTVNLAQFVARHDTDPLAALMIHVRSPYLPPDRSASRAWRIERSVTCLSVSTRDNEVSAKRSLKSRCFFDRTMTIGVPDLRQAAAIFS